MVSVVKINKKNITIIQRHLTKYLQGYIKTISNSVFPSDRENRQRYITDISSRFDILINHYQNDSSIDQLLQDWSDLLTCVLDSRLDFHRVSAPVLPTGNTVRVFGTALAVAHEALRRIIKKASDEGDNICQQLIAKGQAHYQDFETKYQSLTFSKQSKSLWWFNTIDAPIIANTPENIITITELDSLNRLAIAMSIGNNCDGEKLLAEPSPVRENDNTPILTRQGNANLCFIPALSENTVKDLIKGIENEAIPKPIIKNK